MGDGPAPPAWMHSRPARIVVPPLRILAEHLGLPFAAEYPNHGLLWDPDCHVLRFGREADRQAPALKVIAIWRSLPILRRKRSPARPRTPTDFPHVFAQRGDHRPCRPWQDHAGRPPAAAVRRVPREPAGGRTRA